MDHDGKFNEGKVLSMKSASLWWFITKKKYMTLFFEMI